MGRVILEGIDYRSVLLQEPSAMEQIYAIFANVIELDEDGVVVNAKYAERRAAQWLRRYIHGNYEIMPPLESWETSYTDPHRRSIQRWRLPVQASQEVYRLASRPA